MKSRGLNERERRFVEAYMACGKATDSARRAGYSKRTAASIGSRLLRKVKIRQAIDARVEKDPTVATRIDRQTFWTKVMNDSAQDMKDRLTASQLLGKTQGDFIQKIEVIEASKLSDETLRRALDETGRTS